MTLFFLLSLTIALIAASVGYQSREEIVTPFSFIVAVISLMISLVLAPWMVQLLILVVGVLGMRYFCDRHSCQNSLSSPPSDSK